MNFSVVIKEGARSDITEAHRRYAEINAALGDDFLNLLDDAFERISLAPESYAAVFHDIRQMRIRRFPYVVSYLFENDCILVLAVLLR